MANLAAVTIRVATTDDLPYIHTLIRESYGAMVPYYPALESMWTAGAENSFTEDGDLHCTTFERKYHSCSFWVCQLNSDSSIVGCVGLKRHGDDDAELVRMSISSVMRGGGLGQLIVKHLETFCNDHGILRIQAVTANPGAASFYEKKCGFVIIDTFSHAVGETTIRGSKLVRYLGERLLGKVAIVGGTHGNESIGVKLIRQWTAETELNMGCEIHRESFSSIVRVGNPQAVDACMRFLDADLNRQFLTTSKSMEATNGNTPTTVEAQRAMDLQLSLGLGRKRLETDSSATIRSSGVDFIIDLHSTSSNVGLMCMISAGDYDPVTSRLAAQLLTLFPDLKITYSGGKKWDSWSLDSVSPYGLAFEVGPCVHGVIDSELLEQTRALIGATLDFIELRNNRLSPHISGSGGVVARGSVTEYISSSGAPRALYVYMHVAYIYFPTVNSCVHPRLVGQDFTHICDGDIAFISTDGLKTEGIFRYPADDMGRDVPSPIAERKELFVVFVNEASYVAKNIAFAVYSKHKKTLY